MQTLEKARPPATTDTLPDHAITEAIELFFITKKGVVSNQIGVTTKAGIVELTGQTTSLLSRDRAEEIALAVRGVRAVLNELTIVTDDVPDGRLLLDVTQALATDPATRDYDLRCATRQGVVTLAGQVPSWAEKQLALRIVRGIGGVRAVAAERLLVCRGECQRTDAALATLLQEVLDWDIRVNPHLLHVRCSNQVVYLSGTVGSAEEKTRLVSLAYQVGAGCVEASDLAVADWAQEPGLCRNKFVPRTDEEVAQAVRDILQRDPRTRAFALRVHVCDGAVTLAGAVDNYVAREAAGHDAHHVVGVWEVHNLLKVHPGRTWADSQIRQAIADALARDPYVCHAELLVNVLDGKAYLYGRVASQFEQEHACRLAATTSGVVAVANHLILKELEPKPGLLYSDYQRTA